MQANERLDSNTALQLGFARRVRQARRAAGMRTQGDLALAIGMAGASVSNWERALQFCHPTDLLRLARALGVTTDWLISGDETFLTMDAKRRLGSQK